jgi:hypothetical protein
MNMKETPRRRITVTSSVNEISTDQLGNRVVGEWVKRYSAPNPPLSTSRLRRWVNSISDICHMFIKYL